jgi:DNA polymerase-1
MRDPPLHGVPKRSREARILRRAFEGPPGYELIDADYNSFEARVLAALSKDPMLLAAASSADMIKALIGQLAGGIPLSRQEVKVALYSFIYGRSRDGFWRGQPTMMRPKAEALYDLIGSTLTTMVSYRDDVLKRWKKDRCVRTIGGWYRGPRTKRSAFSTMIQGSAADLLRWVLRRLEQVLPPTAFVVHQVHDQVIIATPPADATNVEQILLDVMQRDIVTMCPFYPPGLVLRANVHRGRSWRDLL